MGRKAKRQTGAGRAVGYIRVSTAAQATEGLSLSLIHISEPTRPY